MVDEATDMTAFGRRKEAVDVVDVRAELLCSLMQNLHEAPKAHIGDFAAPHGSHATQFEVFKIDRIIALAQPSCCLPVPGMPLIGNTAMKGRKCLPGLVSVVRPWHLTRQSAVGFAYRAQRLSEGLGSMDIMPVVSGEECRESEVKACGLTRLDSDTGLILSETREDDLHTSGGQAFDGEGFDRPCDVPGVMETIETPTQPYAVTLLIAPTRLCQRDRVVFGAFAEGWWTLVLFAKELLIALVDAPDNVLDGLGIQLFPMGKACQALQLCDMAFEAIVADVAFEPPIIAFLHGDEMVVDLGCQVDLAMQMTPPFGAVELKDEGPPCHLCALLCVNIAFDHLQRDGSDRGNKLRSGPQRGQALFEPGKLRTQHMDCIAFGLSHNLCNAGLRIHIEQQMDMIGHHFHAHHGVPILYATFDSLYA